MTDIDPVALTADLIRCPSVTPAEAGALSLLETLLVGHGFACSRIKRGGIDNLFARWGVGKNGKSFAFNGHTDVVPVGDLSQWQSDPFGGDIKDGVLYGRGAVDMKSGVAAFAAAAIEFVNETPPDGSVVLMITGDEEGDAHHGTTAILDWMREAGESIDHCLVGEPTSPNHMGEMMKIGRRGSLTAFITAQGVQGHSAYPHRAKNPLTALVALLDRLATHPLDQGTAHFDASTLAITTIDTGNAATNVIPAAAKATVNIRFNDTHSSQDLITWLEKQALQQSANSGVEFAIDVKVSGESFLTPPGLLSQLIGDAAEAELGCRPAHSTTGGTSDARFVKDICPVTEFGLVGKGMHGVDECVPVEQIHQLKAIYRRILQAYFE